MATERMARLGAANMAKQKGSGSSKTFLSTGQFPML